MATFKCKMCGGEMELPQGATVCTCEYCGTKQTLPKLDSEKRANLYDRANHFRRNNDFDKAMAIYESILNEDSSDAEAYWSIVLCRYGIEYVEDPSSHKRIPTVNRAQFTSVLADEDYKSALKYSDTLQKTVYEAEAKAIDDIQKGILEISSKEEPFDVFICYKETDANGRRTPDSVLANDLYHQLVQEGFKVFFSRITLEDKLGQEYEPYIFAALNSAKVMVALGTKPEYFNAVWVKNEWSRYLALIRSGKKKMLIPAFRDMDPYDLPEEFSHLQAQDMSKLGFMQDLIRGIKKILDADVTKPQVIQETKIINNAAGAAGSTNIDPLLKRVFMFLEDGDFKSANEYCERVLDVDPENAQAYLGKLMAELRVRREGDMPDHAQPFDNSNNYQKALRFGDDVLRGKLTTWTAHIKERNETARKQGIYDKATQDMRSAKVENSYRTAASEFRKIPGFKDADKQAKLCDEQAEVCRKDVIYSQARQSMSRGIESYYEEAIKEFQKIPGWKDADKCIAECREAIEKIKAEDEQKRIEAERREEEKRLAAEKTAKKTKRFFAVLLIVALLAGIGYRFYLDTRKAQLPVGKIISFGAYEQDNNKSNGKESIEWQVLANDGKKALLISKYALDCQQYNTKYTNITWEQCTLRTWLNNDFYQAAFSADEQKQIITANVSADKNPKYSTDPGKATQDKVFLLSIAEAEKYFTTDEARKCAPTAYAKENGAWTSDSYKTASGEATCWWWLRSPGLSQISAALVYFDGSVDYYGSYVDRDDGCVRPALWINLES